MSPKAFGLAFGILWALVMFVLTMFSAVNGYAAEFLIVMAGIYPLFSLTYFGAVIGAIYGFVSGFVMGWLWVWLYNKFL